MRAAGVAEELLHLRSARRHLLALGVLAIEHPDGIGLDALLAILAKIGGARAQIVLQSLLILGPAIGVAQSIQMHFKRNAELAQPAIEKLDLLRVDARPGAPQRLHADLRELAVAPALLPLAPEHRAQVPPLRLRLLLIDVVLDVGAHQGGGVLRPHRDALAVIVEGVHLLADYVGALADAARE